MLDEAKEVQNNAVRKLLSLVKERETITFKAPTGSGKTHMMADFMNELLSQDSHIVFLVSSLSKGNLAAQNNEKFMEYKEKGSFPFLEPYLINTDITSEENLFIPPSFNVYSLPRDLFKSGGRIEQSNALDSLFLTLQKDGKEIYLIKDECHQDTNKLDTLNKYFSRIINFSATPSSRKGQIPDVEIKEEDAIRSKLIKKIEWLSEDESIEDAINKLEEIKKEYIHEIGQTPCLIIQTSNKDKGKDEWDEIHKVLDKHPSLKWMLIVNTDKDCDTNDIIKKKYPNNKRKWEEYAKENTSLIDVIIFKMVITEGWDIPRACMLYQVRDTKSKQLDEQVLGRVRRNPRLTDFENLTKEGKELAMKCYVWGYKDKDEGEEVPVELKDKNIRLELTVQTTKLKELTKRVDFNLDTFLNSTKPSVESQSIFKLNRSLKRASNDVQALVSGYSDSYSKWFHASEHLDDIVNKNNELNCNYSESIILDIQATFPRESYYNKTEITREEDGWIWEKRNKGRTSSTIFNKDDEFSFDSEAEKEWARFLSKISSTCVEHLSVLDLEKRTLLWGKNFLPNSNIKFQYYKNGYHDSYPDFVLKDKKGRIHIFEVKSVNTRTDVGFDTEEYKEKIEELKKMYKEASKVTHQFFYIPVKNGNGWDIFKYEEGEKEEISLEQLIAILKGENK